MGDDSIWAAKEQIRKLPSSEKLRQILCECTHVNGRDADMQAADQHDTALPLLTFRWTHAIALRGGGSVPTPNRQPMGA